MGNEQQKASEPSVSGLASPRTSERLLESDSGEDDLDRNELEGVLERDDEYNSSGDRVVSLSSNQPRKTSRSALGSVGREKDHLGLRKTSLSHISNKAVDLGDQLIPVVTKAGDDAHVCVFQPVLSPTEPLRALWKTKLEKPNFVLFNDRYNVYGCSLHLDADGYLFVGYGNFFYSFIAKNGALRWRIERSGDTFEDMILFGENHFIVSWKTLLVAYSKSGQELWVKKLDGEGNRFQVLSAMLLLNGVLYVHNTTSLIAVNPFSNNDAILWKFPTHEFKFVCAVCSRAVMSYSPEVKAMQILSRGRFVTLYLGEDGKDFSQLKVIRDVQVFEGMVASLYPKLMRCPQPGVDRELIVLFADQELVCFDDRITDFMWNKKIQASLPPLMFNVVYSQRIVISGYQGYIDFTDLKTLQTSRLQLKDEKEPFDVMKSGYVSLMLRAGKLIAACEGVLYLIEYRDLVTPSILARLDFNSVFGTAMFAFPLVEFKEPKYDWNHSNWFLIQ
jgi:hypothetical protein